MHKVAQHLTSPESTRQEWRPTHLPESRNLRSECSRRPRTCLEISSVGTSEEWAASMSPTNIPHHPKRCEKSRLKASAAGPGSSVHKDTKTMRTGRAVRAVTAEGSSGSGRTSIVLQVTIIMCSSFHVRAAERRVVPSLATSGAIRKVVCEAQTMELDSGGALSCATHSWLNRIPPGEREIERKIPLLYLAPFDLPTTSYGSSGSSVSVLY
ncbi:uncharacterized protein F5Z01DRAFT_472255 [Emericellopsis atlantica]|uniref:Uncharacterized protein n=1 Tax=Emericellopsis atlantica TaxID=2614577 RepID=A0A9P7ZDU8_9HYPO|nr:uncharacterized protein F5Z01DRAFT_472255 [Emericellopsis atlantica]KAG9249633.1 hypothetical protein F5Z01DRAFT_472255 [Emericellopsis atlantica]